MSKNFNLLLMHLCKYINYQLNAFKVIFIFDKEEINKLYDSFIKMKKDIDGLYDNLEKENFNFGKPTNEMECKEEFFQYQKLKKKISKFGSDFGPQICNSNNIAYILFSMRDLKLFDEDNNQINEYKQLFSLNVEKTKIPINIIKALNSYSDFKNLKELKIIEKIDNKIKDFSLEKGFCFLNLDILAYENFNIMYYSKNEYFYISFENGVVSPQRDREYANNYILKAKFDKKEKSNLIGKKKTKNK